MSQPPLLIEDRGQALLDNPSRNKGSAFSEDERRELGLLGLLPPHVSTIEEQLERAYENFRRSHTQLERYIFLGALQDRNETLFYRLVQRHLKEMLPVIYTPGVGAGCQHYSHIYRRPRGLYLSYPHMDDIDTILRNAPSPHPEVIVVTDGERILGLGDLGIGGIGIPIGKLALYTLCAGINPAATLPIVLDVGTNNQALLDDPLYLGWRHHRVRPGDYDAFVDAFVSGIIRRFPHALLQWEDFSKQNAARLLARYRDQLCTFNDDIQGTGAVTLAGLLSAMTVTGQRLRDQQIAILGAGSAAIGISDQLVAAMMGEGLSRSDARAAIWLVDSEGLVHTGRGHLDAVKRPYAQDHRRIEGWGTTPPARVDLHAVVRHVHPGVLIGVAAQPGAFTEPIIREMADGVTQPIVFALSNPTSKSEAVPADVMAWTEGRALVATGSPFPGVGQCNNVFIFPGVGLGVLASLARRVTDDMFVAAARELSAWSPARRNPTDMLYPDLAVVRDVARAVAIVVGEEAQRANLAPKTSREELTRRVDEKMWTPEYVSYTPAVLDHTPK